MDSQLRIAFNFVTDIKPNDQTVIKKCKIINMRKNNERGIITYTFMGSIARWSLNTTRWPFFSLTLPGIHLSNLLSTY